MTSHDERQIGPLGWFVVISIVGMIGTVSWFSNRYHDQQREIARLSSVCPSAEAGEQLVSSVRHMQGEKPGDLRCTYTSNSGYGRSSRSRPAVPGRAS